MSVWRYPSNLSLFFSIRAGTVAILSWSNQQIWDKTSCSSVICLALAPQHPASHHSHVPTCTSWCEILQLFTRYTSFLIENSKWAVSYIVLFYSIWALRALYTTIPIQKSMFFSMPLPNIHTHSHHNESFIGQLWVSVSCTRTLWYADCERLQSLKVSHSTLSVLAKPPL